MLRISEDTIIINTNFKSCPFCGCKVTIESSLPMRNRAGLEFYIARGEHKSPCPFSGERMGNPISMDPDKLIEEWNTRV